MSNKQSIKGKQKQHDLWMDEEINDYAFLDDDDDSPELIREYEQKLANQAKYTNTPVLYSDKPQGKKKDRKVTLSLDFNFFALLEKLPLDCLIDILLFLGIKDLPIFLCTSKSINNLIRNDKVWVELCVRYFYINRPIGSLEGLIPKSLFRSSVHYAIANIRFNSELFLKSASISASQLVKSLQVLTAPRRQNIVFYIHEVLEKMKRVKSSSSWSNDLKVSWDRAENTVYLWIAGVSKNQDPKTKDPKKGRHTPEANVLRKYNFQKERQICSTFFVEDKYLLIEVKENKRDPNENSRETGNNNDVEDREEVKQDETQNRLDGDHYNFFIFDIEKELKYLIRDDEYPSADTYAVYSKELNQGIISPITKDSASSEERHRGCGLVTKILNEEVVLFFEQDTSRPLITVYNVKARRLIYKTNLELKHPLYDIIPSKKVQDSGEVKFYVLDKSLELSAITINSESEMKVHQIFSVEKFPDEFEDQAEKNKSLPVQNQRFPRAGRVSHYGIYKSPSEKEPFEIEYLILNRSRTFFFINLEIGEVYDFVFLNTGELHDTIVHNWDVYENRLCVFSNTGLHSHCFSMERSISKINEKVEVRTKFQVKKYLDINLHGRLTACFMTHWVIANDCYTLIVSGYPNNFKRVDMRVLVIPSQRLADLTTSSTEFEFDLTNILTQRYNKDEQPQILQEKVQVKLENQNIFVKGSKRSFFCLLESLKKKEVLDKANYYLKSIYINLEAVSEVRGANIDYKTKEKVHLRHLDKLHKNTNQKANKKLWNDTEKKEDGKEERQQDRVNKGKGDNYFKNVRQNQRSEKQV